MFFFLHVMGLGGLAGGHKGEKNVLFKASTYEDNI